MAAFVVCIVLIVGFMMNDNIKNEEQVMKHLGVPTLVTIPYISEKDRERELSKRKKKDKYIE